MKNIIAGLMLLALICSCNKQNFNAFDRPSDDDMVEVSFKMSSGAVADLTESDYTKVTNVDEFFDGGVAYGFDHVDIFVFNASTGVLEAKKGFNRLDDDPPYTINMTSTPKNVYALTNWDLETLGVDFPDEQSLLDYVFGGKIDGFVKYHTVPMIGRILDLKPLDVKNYAMIEMILMCAQVRLLSTCFDIPEKIAPYFQGAGISGISIMNTVDSIRISDYLDSAYTHTKLCNTTAEDFTYDFTKYECKFGTPGYIRLQDTCSFSTAAYKPSSPLNQEFLYYCLPDDEHDAILSVMVTLNNGSCTYYNVPLGKLKPHKSYEIKKLTVTGVGADDPVTPITRKDAGFVMHVTDFSVAVSEEVTL